MAEKKILKTQIMLRYATHEEWLANDPVLAKGEVAVATVATKKDGEVNYVPSVLLKVGDGTTAYSGLDFVFAKAADVLEACKDTAKLTKFVNDVIANAGIATDEAMQALAGRVATAESGNSRKTTWLPRHRKMRPLAATAYQEKSHVPS